MLGGTISRTEEQGWGVWPSGRASVYYAGDPGPIPNTVTSLTWLKSWRWWGWQSGVSNLYVDLVNIHRDSISCSWDCPWTHCVAKRVASYLRSWDYRCTPPTRLTHEQKASALPTDHTPSLNPCIFWVRSTKNGLMLSQSWSSSYRFLKLWQIRAMELGELPSKSGEVKASPWSSWDYSPMQTPAWSCKPLLAKGHGLNRPKFWSRRAQCVLPDFLLVWWREETLACRDLDKQKHQTKASLAGTLHR